VTPSELLKTVELPASYHTVALQQQEAPAHLCMCMPFLLSSPKPQRCPAISNSPCNRDRGNVGRNCQLLSWTLHGFAE
jgi:hypothetical protein